MDKFKDKIFEWVSNCDCNAEKVSNATKRTTCKSATPNGFGSNKDKPQGLRKNRKLSPRIGNYALT